MFEYRSDCSHLYVRGLVWYVTDELTLRLRWVAQATASSVTREEFNRSVISVCETENLCK